MNIKNTCAIAITCLFSYQCIGQITIMSNSPYKSMEFYKYDSLSNFQLQKNGEHFSYNHLIGQTILFCSAPYYGEYPRGCEMGEYYTIDSILPDDVGKGLYNCLSLTNQRTKQTVLLGGIFDKNNTQFVVVGHIEKLKSLYLGREYYYVGCKGISNYYHERDHLCKMENNEMARNIEEGSLWTCIDVQVKPRAKNDGMDIDKRSPIVFIFDNPQYGKHYCYYEGEMGHPIKSHDSMEIPLLCGLFTDKAYYDSIQTEKEENLKKRTIEMVKKYGNTNGTFIAKGIVRIGMTKTMCRDAWGEPSEINTTNGAGGVHEQWVYGDNTYLYFENGKLTTIQN